MRGGVLDCFSWFVSREGFIPGTSSTRVRLSTLSTECAARSKIRYVAHCRTHERPKVAVVAPLGSSQGDSANQAQSGRAKVSVVIVNWNTPKLLRRCLQSLQDDIDRALCEIIVVDNGSQDGSQAMVEEEFPHLLLIRNAENRGFAAATNQGFSRARAEYVLLLNSDAEVDKEAIGATVDFMERSSDVAVAGCRVILPDGRPQSSCFRDPSLSAVVASALYLAQLFPKSALLNRERYGFATWEHVQDVDCVMGGFMMIRRASAIEEPLRDEGYFLYGEEVDLTHRLQSDGWRVVYLPGSYDRPSPRRQREQSKSRCVGVRGQTARVVALLQEMERRRDRLACKPHHAAGYLSSVLGVVCLRRGGGAQVRLVAEKEVASQVSSLGFSRKGAGSAGVVRQQLGDGGRYQS